MARKKQKEKDNVERYNESAGTKGHGVHGGF